MRYHERIKFGYTVVLFVKRLYYLNKTLLKIIARKVYNYIHDRAHFALLNYRFWAF